ncbi:hypothetical protein [Hoylesella buccalis]|jgi:hypothetical protein|uniref:hypothetical protein n=1 Tax=Hoylesella buccalis TaxID=28127 RepID=UPI00050D98AC|nr:hypothetical protein [Hoylesella buccalis]KGF40866.1 hypothetical protein HMPREF2140_05915 [Hoylesella buccalis DNF00985]
MKKTYEKPVIKILKLDNSMQIICGSGFDTKTSFSVGQWDKPEETDAEGTSEEIKEKDLPEWLKD